MLREDTAVMILSLLDQLKTAAAAADQAAVERLTASIRAFVRCEAAPRLGEHGNKVWPH